MIDKEFRVVRHNYAVTLGRTHFSVEAYGTYFFHFFSDQRSSVRKYGGYRRCGIDVFSDFGKRGKYGRCLDDEQQSLEAKRIYTED